MAGQDIWVWVVILIVIFLVFAGVLLASKWGEGSDNPITGGAGGRKKKFTTMMDDIASRAANLGEESYENNDYDDILADTGRHEKKEPAYNLKDCIIRK